MHEIDVISNGRVSMAFVGETPWHGLGGLLTPGADLDTWIREGGFDFRINESPAMYLNTSRDKVARIESGEDADHMSFFDGRRVLYRSDTGAAIATVSARYNIVHPREIAEFFRELVEASGFTMETIGVLRGGARYWCLARVPGDFKVLGQDEIRPYLLIATSADGSMATSGAFTTIRVVCSNTLSWAIGADGKRAQVRIPHSTKFNADTLKADLGIIPEFWETFQIRSDAMAGRKVTRKEAVKYFMDLFVPEADVNLKDAAKRIEGVMEAYDFGPGSDLATARGTAFGLVNAVTHYVDFDRRTVGGQDGRLDASWFGSGVAVKNKATDLALALL